MQAVVAMLAPIAYLLGPLAIYSLCQVIIAGLRLWREMKAAPHPWDRSS